MAIVSSQLTPVDASVASVPTDLIWRLSTDKYHDLVRAGALTEEDPVEFLEGWLVYKMPKNRQHCLATDHTRHAIERFVPSG